MQGIGKPGVNMGNLQWGTPVDNNFYFPGYAEGGISGDLHHTAMSVELFQRMPQLPSMNTVDQSSPRLWLPEAIINGKAEGYVWDGKSIEAQFNKVTLNQVILLLKCFTNMVDRCLVQCQIQTGTLKCINLKT